MRFEGLAAGESTSIKPVTHFVQVAEAHLPLAKGNHPATPIKTKPRIEKNRVLVTGGAGFVGSHLCTYLVERGDHVRALQCLDSLAACYRRSVISMHSTPLICDAGHLLGQFLHWQQGECQAPA